MLKDEVGSTLDILLLFYDMITKCANKPKTGRKQTRAGSTPTYSLGGRVDEQSLTFRDLEKSGKTVVASFFKSYMHNSQGINYQCKSVVFHSLTYLYPRCEILSR